jgi:hypothetical protein
VNVRRRFSATIVLVLAAGCGGGGHGSTVLPPGTSAAKTATVAFSIAIPRAASGRRRSPRYVSVATQSAAVTVAPAGGTAGAPVVVNCTTSCTGQIAAPIGTDTFAMKLYDTQNASGNLLSTGTTTHAVVIDQANTVNVTFDGVVASLSVSLNPSSIPSGPATTVAVNVAALDAAHNVIVGPGSYVDANDNPVTIKLTDSDTSGATSLSATTFTAPPPGPVTLSYAGALSTPPTITATASGTSSVPSASAILGIGCGVLSGNVYVANGANVLVFAPSAGGNTAPIRTITMQGGESALDVDVAFDGTTYVLEQSGLTIQVATYAPNASGTATPLRTATAFGKNIRLNVAGDLLESAFGAGNGALEIVSASASGSTQPISSIGGPATGLALPTKAACDATGAVWVADALSDVVAQFPASASGNVAPSATLSGDLTGAVYDPVGVAVDPSGTIYATEPGGNFTAMLGPAGGGILPVDTGIPPSVHVFAPSAGQYTTPVSISGPATGLTDPETIAVDALGTIYVVNGDAHTGANQRVLVFAAGSSGNVAPSRTITSSALSKAGGIGGIGLDAAGQLYVLSAPVSSESVVAGIFVFAPGAGANATPIHTISGSNTNISAPTATGFQLAVDPAGNAYVRMNSGGERLLRFAPGSDGNVAPAVAIALGAPGSFGTGTEIGLTADATLHAYVADGTGTAYVYDTTTNSSTPVRQITPLQNTIAPYIIANRNGLALGPGSTLAVTGTIDILTYDASASGQTPPVRRLRGSTVGPRTPSAISFDSAQNVYVYSTGDGAVRVYPAHASGTQAPSRTILGLGADVSPFARYGMAVDPAGTVYADEVDPSTNAPAVAVFAPSANGVIVPTRLIEGSATGLVAPGGMAIGP